MKTNPKFDPLAIFPPDMKALYMRAMAMDVSAMVELRRRFDEDPHLVDKLFKDVGSPPPDQLYTAPPSTTRRRQGNQQGG